MNCDSCIQEEEEEEEEENNHDHKVCLTKNKLLTYVSYCNRSNFDFDSIMSVALGSNELNIYKGSLILHLKNTIEKN